MENLPSQTAHSRRVEKNAPPKQWFREWSLRKVSVLSRTAADGQAGYEIGVSMADPAISPFVIPAEAGIHSRNAGRIATRRLPRGARIMIVAGNGS
jgi:hypothetical protein